MEGAGLKGGMMNKKRRKFIEAKKDSIAFYQKCIRVMDEEIAKHKVIIIHLEQEKRWRKEEIAKWEKEIKEKNESKISGKERR